MLQIKYFSAFFFFLSHWEGTFKIYFPLLKDKCPENQSGEVAC